MYITYFLCFWHILSLLLSIVGMATPPPAHNVSNAVGISVLTCAHNDVDVADNVIMLMLMLMFLCDFWLASVNILQRRPNGCTATSTAKVRYGNNPIFD